MRTRMGRAAAAPKGESGRWPVRSRADLLARASRILEEWLPVEEADLEALPRTDPDWQPRFASWLAALRQYELIERQRRQANSG